MNQLGSCYVCGIPGAGKTLRLMEVFDTLPESAIFINTMRKDYSAGPYVVNLEQLVRALNQHGKAVYNTDDPEAVAKMLNYFERVHTPEHGILRIIIDEVDQYARVYSHASPVERLFTKLRNRGILGVGLAQSTAGQTSKIIIKNAHEYYFFSLYPGEFDEVQRTFKLPFNPPLHEYIRWELGKLYHGDSNGSERPLSTTTASVRDSQAETKEVGTTPEGDNNGQ